MPTRGSTSTTPCVACHDNVTSAQLALECDNCGGWCHEVCPKSKRRSIPDVTYKAIAQDGQSLMWFCPVCKPLKDDIIVSMKEARELKTKMEGYVADLQAQIDRLAAKVNQVNAQTPSNRVSVEAEIAEAMAREKKRLNLVIVGFPETDATSTRSEGDRAFVDSMSEQMGVNKTDIIDVFRDGVSKESTPDRPYSRIIKVKLDNFSSKLKFLRNFNRTKPAQYKRTYVRHDMTFRERQIDKELKLELDRRRRDGPGLDLIIRNGRIIERPVSRTTA